MTADAMPLTETYFLVARAGATLRPCCIACRSRMGTFPIVAVGTLHDADACAAIMKHRLTGGHSGPGDDRKIRGTLPPTAETHEPSPRGRHSWRWAAHPSRG